VHQVRVLIEQLSSLSKFKAREFCGLGSKMMDKSVGKDSTGGAKQVTRSSEASDALFLSTYPLENT
jgi:hypothetical protein